MRILNVRALHRPLTDAGLVPANCRLMSIHVGVSGGLHVTYEVYLDPSQVSTLGRILQAVGDELSSDEPSSDEPEPGIP